MALPAVSSEPADNVVESTIDQVLGGIEGILPALVSAALFLVVAYVAIRLVTWVVRRVLRRLYSDQAGLLVDLGVTVVATLLWFAALLSVLKILGLGEIAASLGTATGFIALGISYALSDMIEDVVSGVYLLRDPDFEEGDEVVTGKGEGVVEDIGLRKSRLRRPDGDLQVVRNADIEAGWTWRAAGE